MKNKIIKYGSHCYDAMGWNECTWWDYSADKNSLCLLFGRGLGVKKDASEALNICNKIYGPDYEGKP